MCIDKEDFRSCMNEKRFQEVVEDVAFQRARHLERRERQLLLGKGKVHAATSPTIMVIMRVVTPPLLLELPFEYPLAGQLILRFDLVCIG